MKRIKEIDIAKGIGIILVLVGHLTENEIHSFIYLFHMPLFFFISGMVYNQNNKYVTKRVKQIIIPFVIFILVSFPFKFAERCIIQHHIYINLSYFTIQFINIPLWFCWSLFIISCLYYIIDRIIKYNSNILIITIFISIIGFILAQYDVILPFYLSQSFLAFPFYALGHFQKKQILLNWGGCFISLCVLIYAYFTNIQTNIGGLTTDNNPIFFYAPAYAGIYLTLYVSKYIVLLFKHDYLSYLGRNSLVIFGFHWPFITIINKMLLIFNIHPFITFIFTFIAILCISLIIGYILSYMFPEVFNKNYISFRSFERKKQKSYNILL